MSEMSIQAIRGSFLMEYLPENVIWVFVVLQSNCSDVSAYLMLKLVQPLEGIEAFPLLYS